jgi:tetratricopeptide (TPR) repeat protein
LQQPAGVLLRPSAPTRARSARLEQIAQQADKRIRRGFELAGREAHFAARSEFIMALRLIAQGLDVEYGTPVHSRALAVALTAIKEADDFIPKGTKLEADLDLASLIAGHRTPVLKETDTSRLTPMLALSSYFTFAQEQLSVSVGREVAGSMALHALGKLHGALARENALQLRSAEPKAIAFFQAALLVFPQNYLAANDLGVLLAKCGSYPQAQTMLEHSLALNQQSTGWHNLAVVYQQQGQLGLAYRAQQQSAAMRRGATGRPVSVGRSGMGVQWLPPGAFAQARPGSGNVLPVAPARRPAPQRRLQPPAPVRPPVSQAQRQPAATVQQPQRTSQLMPKTPWFLPSGRPKPL